MNDKDEKIDQLLKDNASLNDKVKDLEKKISLLTQDNGKLQEELDDTLKKIPVLEKKIECRDLNITKLETDLSKANNEKNRLLDQVKSGNDYSLMKQMVQELQQIYHSQGLKQTLSEE